MKEKNNKKKLLTIAGIVGFFTLLLTSCNSFCSAKDNASYRYAYDPINTQFFETEEQAKSYVFNTLKKDEKKVYLDKNKTKELTLENVDEIKVSDINGEGGTSSLISSYSQNDFTNLNFKGSDELIYLKTGVVTTYYVEPAKKEGEEEKVKAVYTTFSKNSFVKSLDNQAVNQKISLPANTYWNDLDVKVIDEAVKNSGEFFKDKNFESTYELIYGYDYDSITDYRNNPSTKKEKILLEGGTYTTDEGKTKETLGRNNSLLINFGKYKYLTDKSKDSVLMEEGDYWGNITKWNQEIKEKNGNIDGYVINNDYLSVYKTSMNQKVASLKSCFAIEESFYGHISDDPINDTVLITNKSNYGDAWKHGWLEGLLVYPIAYMTEYFSQAFGMNGWGQISAVLLVTLIVRGLFMLITFKSTLSQQKMQYLQPEIAKLQQKYPNSNENQYEKQRLAQAQMNLYKRYKIHPFANILIMFIQFPIFIAVWNGLSGAASLSRDAVLGLRLSDTISSVLFTWSNWPGAECWTALSLIILMSAGQILSMQLPNWLSKKRTKNISKMYKNPAQNSTQKQMKIVSWVMTIFIIIMGFTLPAAMGVYWLAGAIFSMLQQGIMHFVMKKKGGLKPKGEK